MAVKVGNSWVSEAAYDYAKGKMEAESAAEGRETDKKNSVLSELKEKYSDVKFSTNTAPFSGKGGNNLAIAPNILKQMESDPEKRLEYEALIYDCAQGIQSGMFRREGVIAGGFIITADGGLRAWSISRSGSGTKRSLFDLDKKDKASWPEKIREKIKIQRKKAQETQEKKKKNKLDVQV